MVENPAGASSHYLLTPATSSLILSNGANTGSVAAFSSDGSTVLHGDVTIQGTLTNSKLDATLSNPGNGYDYLNTPPNSSLIVNDGDLTAAVAAFNFDGSSVLHGNVAIVGNITNAGLQSTLDSLAFTPVSPLAFGMDVNTGAKTLQADLSLYQQKLDAGAAVN